MRKVLIIFDRSIGKFFWGGEIRAIKIAEFLKKKGILVVLLANKCAFRGDKNFLFVDSRSEREKVVKDFKPDIFIIESWEVGLSKKILQDLTGKEVYIIQDISCPRHLEVIYEKNPLRERIESYFQIVNMFIPRILRQADFLICGSPRQKDMWIGFMSALGLLGNNIILEEDLDFIEVIPYGVDEEKCPASPPLEDETLKIGWFGSMWDWYDPFPMLKAVRRLIDEGYGLRYFSTPLTAPSGEEPRIALRFKEMVKDLDLESVVSFSKERYPYDKRWKFFNQVNVGVISASETLEDIYSIRVRFFDYVWAGVPIIVSGKGYVSDIVKDYGIGLVIRNVEEEWYKALRKLADVSFRLECAKRIKEVRRDFSWDKVIEPLVRYCNNPKRMIDHEWIEAYWDALKNGLNRAIELKGSLKVMVWGAGKAGKIFYETLGDKIDIVGYIDSDKKKWGKRLGDVPIYSPESAKEMIFEDKSMFVVIATEPGRKEVESLLRGWGLSERRFSYYLSPMFFYLDMFL